MARRIIVGACPLALVWILSCSNPGAVRRDGRVYWERPGAHRGPQDVVVAPKIELPPWMLQLPRKAGTRFFLGEFEGVATEEEALARAWATALTRIGIAEFPAAAAVKSISKETLHGSSYEREFQLRLDQVDWTGLREATEQGSPFVQWDAGRGVYRVARLLAWDEGGLQSAKSSLFKKKGRRPPPMPPESVRREEVRIVEAEARAERLKEKLEKRQQALERIFGKLQCGTTVGDVIAILGSPDRFNPNNAVLFEKEYFWGPYRLMRRGPDPRVASIQREPTGPERILCRDEKFSRR